MFRPLLFGMCMTLASPPLLQAADNPRQLVLATLAAMAAKSIDRLNALDVPGALGVFKSFEALWSPIEDSVRAGNPGLYARIEVAAARAEAAMEAAPPDTARAGQALSDLARAAEEYGRTAAGPPAARTGSVESLGTLLAQVRDSLATARFDQASDLMESFVGLWPIVETDVKSRSPAIYSRLEAEMTRVSSLILSGPGSRPAAMNVLEVMLGQIEQLRVSAGYTAWDAGFILLREGMEALLVLAALLAMLKKTPAGNAPLWVWAGAGSGLLLSAGLALVLSLLISAAGAAATREVLEGAVGLASVILMMSVGAWLHRRANLKAWSGYMQSRAGRAIAAGGTWSLFALALFAVLREGAETVILLVGIESGIGPVQLFAGVGVALVLLVLIGFLVIRFSARLPLHYFFLVATILIYYLAFKIAGESIHSLQVAGIIPSHYAERLPAVGPLGMSQTWETFALQAIVLALVCAEIATTEARRSTGKRKNAS
ncbi:MAG: FTR1 family protein [Spirochaetia bacterium]|jgi:high-affinity iron transporter